MIDRPIKSDTYEVNANDFSVAGKVSSDIKKDLKKLNINPKIIRKIAIVSYEAEINIIIHSKGGKIVFELYEDRIVITSKDRGPGISDIELAMKEGYSTATNEVRELGFGAGMGLPNMNRWADEFKIESSSKGTLIRMTIFL